MNKALLKANVVTPEEASKKWCPLVRNLYLNDDDKTTKGVKTDVATSYNADRTHNKCISTNCALWVSAVDGCGCCGASAAANILITLAT